MVSFMFDGLSEVNQAIIENVQPSGRREII